MTDEEPKQDQKEELLKFKRRNVIPPGGYRYEDPDTKHLMQDGHFEGLCKQATRHRSANDLPIPANFPEIVEDWICRRIPPEMTTASPLFVRTHKRPLSSGAVMSATRYILNKYKTNGRKLVSMKKGIERAKVCVECGSNARNSSCFSCRGERSWVQSFIGRRTPLDRDLYVCDITAVINVAYIHMPIKMLDKILSNDTLGIHPEKCWIRKEIEATRNGESD